MDRVIELRKKLVDLLSPSERIFGIGQTGRIDAPLIPGKSDIDLFVLCSEVPPREARELVYRELSYDRLEMQVCSGGVWGCGDILVCDGIDVMPMYFTVREMYGYAEEILAGKHLRREGRFYPIGRLASNESIHVLYDREDVWKNLIARVKHRPQELFEAWYSSESSQMIDEEDLGRAELRREVLFYHQVLEEFLDHFLQALFAKNRCYFPSRKRTEQEIAQFARKPDCCYERLLQIVQLGARAEALFL